MKKNFAKQGRLVMLVAAFASLALSTGCLDDARQTDDIITFNEFSTTIGIESSVAVNDTIWLSGFISSNAFNSTTQDSIFVAPPPNVSFQVLQLVVPDATIINGVEAFPSFSTWTEAGTTLPLAECQNTLVVISPALTDDEERYTFRLGLIPSETGDFVMTWNNSKLTNSNRNGLLINDYQLVNFPGRVNFESCDQVAFLDLDNSQSEFFFSVVE